MPAYAIIDVEIFDIGEYMDYMKLVRPLIAGAGGRYLARGGELRIYDGDYQPGRLVIVEFPSLDALDTFYRSDEFKAVKILRDRCSRTNLVGVQGI
jgi:uncharacterized protein (DUF1330 family)